MVSTMCRICVELDGKCDYAVQCIIREHHLQMHQVRKEEVFFGRALVRIGHLMETGIISIVLSIKTIITEFCLHPLQFVMFVDHENSSTFRMKRKF